MDRQTKDSRLRPEESIRDMLWVRASIARNEKRLERVRELSEKSRRHLEAVFGPFPKG